MDKKYNDKRINPPVWQHDYHVLKRLYQALQNITSTFSGRKSSVILDYGCGTSPYKDLFTSIAGQYIRVDVDKAVDANYVVKEGENIPQKNNSIDIVLSTQVLEHVKNPPFYLKECERLLKKGGLLILSTHGIWPYHGFPSDYHRWTRSGLETEIISYSFKIEKSISILGPFATVIQFEMLLIAERLTKFTIIGRLLLVILSLFGNALIWLEDKIVPATKESDSSLYVICAKKI